MMITDDDDDFYLISYETSTLTNLNRFTPLWFGLVIENIGPVFADGFLTSAIVYYILKQAQNMMSMHNASHAMHQELKTRVVTRSLSST